MVFNEEATSHKLGAPCWNSAGGTQVIHVARRSFAVHVLGVRMRAHALPIGLLSQCMKQKTTSTRLNKSGIAVDRFVQHAINRFVHRGLSSSYQSSQFTSTRNVPPILVLNVIYVAVCIGPRARLPPLR